MKYVSPTIKETAFNCPHCGALAQQLWCSVHAEAMQNGRLPRVFDHEALAKMKFDQTKDAADGAKLKKWAERKAKGRPFFHDGTTYHPADVENLWLTRCFNCNEIAVWMCDRMIYPQKGEAPPANPDLPDDIRRDYDEASTILGPVTVWCRSFEHVMCSKGDELWAHSGRVNFARMRCVSP